MKKPFLKILIPVLAVVIVAGACVAFFALKHEHKFTYETTKLATCVETGVRTGTCSCGEIKTMELPLDNHDWQSATCQVPMTCSVCGATEGGLKGHTWQDATCQAPKTCSVCNLTEGDALTHNWQDATCQAPKTCVLCGATEGDPLPHDWIDATCNEAKTCSVCGATEGEANGHNFENKKCTTCNEWQYTAAEYFIFIPENDGSYSIMAADVNNMPAEVVIPSSYEGKPVTAIAEGGFKWCSSISSILLPESITSVGASAFYECFKLVEVINASQSLTVEYNDENGYLGYYALTISNNDSAYVSKVSSNNGYIVYANGSEKLLLGYNGNESALSTPADITAIYKYAFYRSEISSIEITANVKEIGAHAFEGCENLASFMVGSGVETISENAFNNCSNLAFIEISASVNSIGKDAFFGCNGLNDMNYLGSIDKWVEIKFASSESNPTFHTNKLKINGNELTEVKISTASVINSYAFWNCLNLTSVIIGESVTAISCSVFGGCNSLNSIVFEDDSTWYNVRSEEDWNNATGGSIVAIGEPSENAKTLKENNTRYWYKK